MTDVELTVHQSDLEKIHDALDEAVRFHANRDASNAAQRRVPIVRWSPLTSMLQAELKRVKRLLGLPGGLYP